MNVIKSFLFSFCMLTAVVGLNALDIKQECEEFLKVLTKNQNTDIAKQLVEKSFLLAVREQSLISKFQQCKVLDNCNGLAEELAEYKKSVVAVQELAQQMGETEEAKQFVKACRDN